MVGADETTELWRPPLRSSLARGDEEVWYRPNGASSTIPVILGYFINAIAYCLTINLYIKCAGHTSEQTFLNLLLI